MLWSNKSAGVQCAAMRYRNDFSGKRAHSLPEASGCKWRREKGECGALVAWDWRNDERHPEGNHDQKLAGQEKESRMGAQLAGLNHSGCQYGPLDPKRRKCIRFLINRTHQHARISLAIIGRIKRNCGAGSRRFKLSLKSPLGSTSHNRRSQ